MLDDVGTSQLFQLGNVFPVELEMCEEAMFECHFVCYVHALIHAKAQRRLHLCPNTSGR